MSSTVAAPQDNFIPFNANLIVEKCSAIPIPAELLVPRYIEQYTHFDVNCSEFCHNLSLVTRILQYKHAFGNLEEAQCFCLQGLLCYRQAGLKLLIDQKKQASSVVSQVVQSCNANSIVPPAAFPLECELEFVDIAFTVCGLWVMYATLLGQCKGEFFNMLNPSSPSQRLVSQSIMEQAESLKNLFQDLEPVFRDMKKGASMSCKGSLLQAEKIVYEHALCCPVAKLTNSIWIACARFCGRVSAQVGLDNVPISPKPKQILEKGIQAFDNFVPNTCFFAYLKDQAKQSIENELQNSIATKNPSLSCYWQSSPIDISSAALPSCEKEKQT